MTYDPSANSSGCYDDAVSELRWRKECESIPAKRVEHIGACTLFLGDSLVILPHLKADHVLTDPPYEAHMHDSKRGVKIRGAQKRIRADGHANPPPVDFASIEHLRSPVTPMMVSACGGWLVVFCTPEGVAAWRDAIEATGARYKRACHWVKPDSAPQFNGQGPAMGAEMFVTAWCGRGHSHWNGGGSLGASLTPDQADGHADTLREMAKIARGGGA